MRFNRIAIYCRYNNLQLADSDIHGNAIGSPIYISVCVFVLAAYLHSCLMISNIFFPRYSLNATVSDGRFSVTVGVSVQVEQARMRWCRMP